MSWRLKIRRSIHYHLHLHLVLIRLHATYGLGTRFYYEATAPLVAFAVGSLSLRLVLYFHGSFDIPHRLGYKQCDVALHMTRAQ